jgi:hypothetical protein
MAGELSWPAAGSSNSSWMAAGLRRSTSQPDPLKAPFRPGPNPPPDGRAGVLRGCEIHTTRGGTMKARTRLGLVIAAPLLAAGLLSSPAQAAPSDNGGPNSNGCTKQLGSTGGEAKQKVNANAHKGAGGAENYPTNCDHFFQSL